MRRQYLVELDKPGRVSEGEMRGYIVEAIQTLIGSRMPEDPMFDLDRESVKAQRITSVVINKLIRENK